MEYRETEEQRERNAVARKDGGDIAKGDVDSLDRREAIVTIGKFSAFTAPAMVSLLVANPTEAFGGSGAGGMRPKKGYKKFKRKVRKIKSRGRFKHRFKH